YWLVFIETLINTLYSDIRGGTSMRDREPFDSVDCGSPRDTARCGVPGVTLNAPKPDENPSGMRGKEMRQ
ncbi:MAG: hypothetical protein QW630_06460, partial [Sulfolobales archaeon]